MIKAERQRKYRLNNPDKVKESKQKYYQSHKKEQRERERVLYHKSESIRRIIQSNSLKRLYGITIEQYDSMLLEQGGVCKVCKQFPPTGKRLCVDHDHSIIDEIKIRGLLCHRCNITLGNLRDDKVLLKNMLEYLDTN